MFFSLPAVSYHESILKILSMDSRKEPTTTGTKFERISADVDDDDDLVLILGDRGSACLILPRIHTRDFDYGFDDYDETQ